MNEPSTTGAPWDVLIVGAGPAGIGVALALKEEGVENVRILDAKSVGSSFENWPEGTRLITPSFPSNGFGLADLNAIHPDTSPAYAYGKEHLTGPEYADYLRLMVRHFQLDVQAPVMVKAIEPGQDARWAVVTDQGTFLARNVVWAGGEYQNPRTDLPGSEHARLWPQVKDFRELPGDEHVVLGGGEGGVDAALQLVQAGKRVTLVSENETWNRKDAEPSIALTPYTQFRLRNALASEPEQFRFLKRSVKAIRRTRTGYKVQMQRGSLESEQPPILALGYHAMSPVLQFLVGPTARVSHEDESIEGYEGLYWSGPGVRHGESPFCYVYKFRARHPAIAGAIAKDLGQATGHALELWKDAGMYVDDPTCCDTRCAC